ncbi:hypothetical protein CR513_58235, partial [Mucuna pruriens]
MKHPTKDHSLFGIDLIDELVEECFQLDNNSKGISNFAEDTNSSGCLGSLTEEADYDEVWEVHNISDSKDDNTDIADLNQKAKLIKLLDQVCKSDFSARQRAEFDSNPRRANFVPAKRSRAQQPKTEIMSAHLVPSSTQVGQLDLKESNDNSSFPPPPMELNNLHLEQEDKFLSVLRQHKKAIGWKLFDLLGINPSICMHRILMKEEAKPIRRQQGRMNPTILDVVKKEVTKLLAAGIIYPISDS